MRIPGRSLATDRVVIVQLVYFPGCPHVDAARALLRRIGVPFEEVDTSSRSAPELLRGWGSPTILVNGRDVAGGSRTSGDSCRLYENGAPTPTEEQIRAALAPSSRGDAVLVVGAAGSASAAAVAGFMALACCAGPAVVAFLGVGGAVMAAALEPWRPWLLGFSILALSFGFWRSYRPRPAGTVCPISAGRVVRTILWSSVAVVVAAIAIPPIYMRLFL